MKEFFESGEYNDIGSSEYNNYSEYTTVAEYGESGEEQYRPQEFSEDSINNPYKQTVDRSKQLKKTRERLSMISAFVLALGVAGATVLSVTRAALVRVSRYIAYEAALAFEFEIIGYDEEEFFVTLSTDTEAEDPHKGNQDPDAEPYYDDPYYYDDYYFGDAMINKEYPRAYFEGLQPETRYLLQVIKIEASADGEHSESKMMFARTYTTGKPGSGMPDRDPWGDDEPWQTDEPWETEEPWQTDVPVSEDSFVFTSVEALENSLEFQFMSTYTDPAQLLAEIDGRTVDVVINGDGTATVFADGLEEATSYTLTVVRTEDGKQVASIEATTGQAAATVEPDAVLTLLSNDESSGIATFKYSLEDPNSHGVTGTLSPADGEAELRVTVSDDGTEVSAVITDMVPGTEYSLVFTDNLTGNEINTINNINAGTTAVTVSVTVLGTTENTDSILLNLMVTNPNKEDITVKLGEQSQVISEATGVTSVTFDGLTADTEYTYEITDASGTVLGSGTATTGKEDAATVSLTNSTLESSYITLIFTVTNPYSHELAVTSNGIAQTPVYSDDTLTLRLTGLTEKTGYLVEITDTNAGATIFSDTFTTKAEPAATAALSSSSIDCFSINLNLSVDNPNGHELALAVDGASRTYTNRISLTDLNPRTSHTVTLTDSHTGDQIFSGTYTTKETITFTQNALGYVTYTVDDSVINKYGEVWLELEPSDDIVDYCDGYVSFASSDGGKTGSEENNHYLIAGSYRVLLRPSTSDDPIEANYYRDFGGISPLTFNVTGDEYTLTFTLASGTLPTPNDEMKESVTFNIYSEDGSLDEYYDSMDGTLTLQNTMTFSSATAAYPETVYYYVSYMFYVEEIDDYESASICFGTYTRG